MVNLLRKNIQDDILTFQSSSKSIKLMSLSCYFCINLFLICGSGRRMDFVHYLQHFPGVLFSEDLKALLEIIYYHSHFFFARIFLIIWYQTNEVSKESVIMSVLPPQNWNVTFPRSYDGKELELVPGCSCSQLCCLGLSKRMNKIWETKFNFFQLTLYQNIYLSVVLFCKQIIYGGGKTTS